MQLNLIFCFTQNTFLFLQNTGFQFFFKYLIHFRTMQCREKFFTLSTVSLAHVIRTQKNVCCCTFTSNEFSFCVLQNSPLNLYWIFIALPECLATASCCCSYCIHFIIINKKKVWFSPQNYFAYTMQHFLVSENFRDILYVRFETASDIDWT